MKKCEKCDKIFKSNWHLQRHLSKKNPCSVSTQNTPFFAQNTPFFAQNTPFSCKYCLETFSRNTNLQRHLTNCREKDDTVRYLEIKLGIQLSSPIDKKKCRFCTKQFTQTGHCTRHIKQCKARIHYKSALEQLDSQSNCHTTNVINNNYTINNNIQVNCLGKENVEYLTTELLKQLWESVKSEEEGFAKTIKIIHGHKEHPENHNIVYTNLKSNVALVKVGTDFEYKNINDVLKDVGSNTLDTIILDAKFDDLGNCIKQKYEKVCDDEELNKKAVNLTKIELYDCYKNGNILKN